MASAAENLKKARFERKKLAEQTSELVIRAAKEKRSMTPAENHEWTTRHADIDRLGEAIKKLEQQDELERELNRLPRDTRTAGREDVDYRRSAGSAGGPPRTAEYSRGGYTDRPIEYGPNENRPAHWEPGMVQRAHYLDELTNDEFRDHVRYSGHVRALGGSSSTGDAMIPQGFVYDLNVVTKFFGGIIAPDVCTYIDTAAGNLMPYPNVDDTGNSGEITAENSQVTIATNATTPADPTFSVVNLSSNMYDSGLERIPQALIDDGAFSIEEVLIGSADIANPRARIGLLATRIGRKLNYDCTNGSGTNQPTGILTAAAFGVNAGTPTTVSYNNILDLEKSIDPSYRGGDGYGPKRAKFMFNDSTLFVLKKLTDSNNRPLWIAGGVAGNIGDERPDTIDGFKYVINQDMPSVGSSNKPILFGDLAKYVIRRVRTLRVKILQERFAEFLQVGYLAFQRFDGQLLTAGSPVKYLQNSAT